MNVHTFVHICSRRFAPLQTTTAHELHTVMASISKLPSGRWRVQVRRGGGYAAKTFTKKSDCEKWALQAERAFETGGAIPNSADQSRFTFSDAINLHLEDMIDVGRAPRRTKAYTLEFLKKRLGQTKLPSLSKAKLIEFGRCRAREGAGPVTVGMELGYIRTILNHAVSLHDLPASTEAVDQARLALKHLGLVGRAIERDRRPTHDELRRIIYYFENNPRQKIPMAPIIRFAVATGLRQEEICRITWRDVNFRDRTLTVKDRKHPREKVGNHQTIALVTDTGFDPISLINMQTRTKEKTARIFPYCGRSVGAAFRRACKVLDITGLRFHDLRHETASRLFEAGYQIPEVALVTGHKDWKMLRRYTNLNPTELVIRKMRI